MPYDVALIIGGWINKVVVPQWQFSLTAAHKNPQQLKESKSIIRQYLFFVITSKKQIPLSLFPFGLEYLPSRAGRKTKNVLRLTSGVSDK